MSPGIPAVYKRLNHHVGLQVAPVVVRSNLNRKAAGFPFSGGWLDPKDLTLDINREDTNLIRNPFSINGEYHARTDWRTNWRKDKRSVLTHVPAAAFALSGLLIPIRPPKCNGSL